MTTASISHTSPRRGAVLALAVALSLAAGVSRADEASAAAPAATSGKTERCLLINRIRRTTVVDQQTVLFYMSGDDVYKNVLPNKCGALRSSDPISYKSSTNQLCSVDTITPLMSAGGGYMPSTSCGLGSFELIDKAAAEKLIVDAKTARNN